MDALNPGTEADADADADAQMREMMGFASFGTQKPTESTEISRPSLIHNAVTIAPGSGHNNTNTDNTNEIQPPFQPQKRQQPSSFRTLNESTWGHLEPSTASAADDNRPIQQPVNVYTNAVTGVAFTRQQLNEYGQGRKRNERGDVVYFKPSFVDEDPWMKIRGRG